MHSFYNGWVGGCLSVLCNFFFFSAVAALSIAREGPLVLNVFGKQRLLFVCGCVRVCNRVIKCDAGIVWLCAVSMHCARAYNAQWKITYSCATMCEANTRLTHADGVRLKRVRTNSQYIQVIFSECKFP